MNIQNISQLTSYLMAFKHTQSLLFLISNEQNYKNRYTCGFRFVYSRANDERKQTR